MKPRILIRADGSSSIGLGHLVRCFALAQMLERNFEIVFYCKEIPSQTKSELESKSFLVHGVNSELDFFSKIQASDIVVLDGYEFTLEDQNKIKSSGALLVSIDDLHDKKYLADLIINHCPGIKALDYDALVQTQFALGTDYVLLRPAFIKSIGKRVSKSIPEALMICFGGADSKNLTVNALKLSLKEDWLKKIYVVSGSAYLFIEELKALCETDNRVKHTHEADEETMLATMMHSDIAIVPTSGILLEALATGCRVISGYFVDNHKFIYSNYKAIDSFIDAGDFSDKLLSDALIIARNSTEPKVPIFDGKSGDRINKLFLNLKVSKQIVLRAANESDIDQTFQWASDPLIRAHSFSQHEIKATEHEQWFNKKVLEPTCLYFIAEKNELLIGSIRFDISSGNALISYLVDSSFHGLGYGQILLRNGLIAMMERIKELKLNVQYVSGMVFKSNIASLKAFQRLGFEITEENSKHITFRKSI